MEQKSKKSSRVRAFSVISVLAIMGAGILSPFAVFAAML